MPNLIYTRTHNRTHNLIFDLDGVVYLSEQEIAGAGATLTALNGAGHHIVFCTNNSSRTRSQSADKIRRVTGYAASPVEIASSAIAAGRLLTPGDRVMMVGGDGIAEAIEAFGGTVVADRPDTVIVGLDQQFTYERMHVASSAVRSGARFIATNLDSSYPTPEGLWPGAGSIVASIRTASGVEPINAGKPEASMRQLLGSLLIDAPTIMIGDRADTDLAMAHAEGWVSVLVGTGVTSIDADLDPEPSHRVASIADFPALLGIMGGGASGA